MGFLEGLYDVVMNVTEKGLRRIDREVTQNFKEASRKYDDENLESVQKYVEAKKKMQEFQKQKADIEEQKIKLKYRHDYENAVKNGDLYEQKKAVYEYNESIKRANYEQEKKENMIYESDVRIQKRKHFYNETLPKIVERIELTKSAINNITDKNFSKDNSKNTKEDDYFEKLYMLYSTRKNNDDKGYFETIKKQEEIIHKVQNGKIELFTNQAKGNFGEMLADSDLRKKGYVRISTETVTSLSDKTHQGIDGIYYNPNANPNYILLEAKYNTSRISTVKEGYKEMSSEWLNDITGRMETDRIKQSLGDMSGEYSDDLAMELFESQLAEDGNVAVLTARISDDNKTIKYIEMDEKGEYATEFYF